MIRIKKGLDLPITGSPASTITSSQSVRSVAIVAGDYVGMKPTMLVQVGDKVLKGQALFEDKKCPGVLFTSPVAGQVLEINRGDKRVFQSVVISNGGNDQVSFKNFIKKNVESYSESEVRALLIESGFWTCLRTRPFSKTPSIDSKPRSIFINVMDTNPLAPDSDVILESELDEFKIGLAAIAKLAPKTFVASHPKSKLRINVPGVVQEHFSGPHPAGNVGTHIHFLDPVSATKTVWHLNYQDVAAIGHLFSSGKYSNRKVVAITGPEAKNPRLVETLRGANLNDLTNDEYTAGVEVRCVSGSVLGGRTARGPLAYLGAFHQQVTLLKEGHYREFLGWQNPGINKYSLKRVMLAKLIPGKKFDMDTNTNGSLRSIVPIGSFEAVMPMDILPTQLLRYMMAGHTDFSANLGALELDEEDLALCTFVDPCKNEYGPALRNILDVIEKEG